MMTLTCTAEGHRHYGLSAEIRDPGHKVNASRACKLIDLAWHPVFGNAASVREHGPWRKES